MAFNRKPIADALLAEDVSAITNPVAKQFRQFAESTGNDLKALAACMGSDRPDLTAEQIAAKKIRVPVMIVIGTKDLMVGDPKLLRDAIPGSKLVMLEGRDHLTAPSDPLYVKAVLEFFKSAPRERARQLIWGVLGCRSGGRGWGPGDGGASRRGRRGLRLALGDGARVNWIASALSLGSGASSIVP